jgi:hypothetical protein
VDVCKPLATGKSVESPPQSSSLTFNEAGEITECTAGAARNSRRIMPCRVTGCQLTQ